MQLCPCFPALPKPGRGYSCTGVSFPALRSPRKPGHRAGLLPLGLGEQAEMEQGYQGSVTHAGVLSQSRTTREEGTNPELGTEPSRDDLGCHTGHAGRLRATGDKAGE